MTDHNGVIAVPDLGTPATQATATTANAIRPARPVRATASGCVGPHRGASPTRSPVLQAVFSVAAVIALPLSAAGQTAGAGGSSLGRPVTDCATGRTEAAVHQMAILAPCSPTVVDANQKSAPALIAMDLSDAAASARAAPIPVSVQALGMQDVEVWTHGRLATRLVAGEPGMFSGSLDLSKEPTGPMHARFYAWDAARGEGATVELVGEETLFVEAGPKTASPFPKGAAGLTLAWQDQYSRLNALPCKPYSGLWPTCKPPTAADGATYLENKGDGADFGDCAFEHTDSLRYNPFAVIDGFLRIRATYNARYVDPYGYGRKWSCGLLKTAFADGTSNVPSQSWGYFEATLLVPNAATGAVTATSGGTWPAFWMASINATAATGSVELDATEQYGNGPGYTQAGLIAYGPAQMANGGKQSLIFHGEPVPGVDLTWDWHRYGLRVTPAKVTAFFDDAAIGEGPMAHYADQSAPVWGFMLNLAMGSGWPVNPPPGGHYDLWVKELRLYK